MKIVSRDGKKFLQMKRSEYQTLSKRVFAAEPPPRPPMTPEEQAQYYRSVGVGSDPRRGLGKNIENPRQQGTGVVQSPHIESVAHIREKARSGRSEFKRIANDVIHDLVQLGWSVDRAVESLKDGFKMVLGARHVKNYFAPLELVFAEEAILVVEELTPQLDGRGLRIVDDLISSLQRLKEKARAAVDPVRAPKP